MKEYQEAENEEEKEDIGLYLKKSLEKVQLLPLLKDG